MRVNKVKTNKWLNNTAANKLYNTTHASLIEVRVGLQSYGNKIDVDKEGETNDSTDNYCDDDSAENNDSNNCTDDSNDDINDDQSGEETMMSALRVLDTI